VCLPELFRTRYFCQTEETAFFDLAEPLPGPTTDALSAAARDAGVVVIAPVFERRAPGVYHNSAAVIDATGRSPESTGRCTSRTTRRSTRSSTSPRGTSAFPRSTPARGGSAPSSAGPVVPGRRTPDGPRRGERPLLPDGDRLAPPRKEEHGERSATPGAPSSGGTPSRTAFTWRRSTGRGRRSRAVGWRRDRILGLLVPVRPAGRDPDRGSADREEILFAEVDLARIEEVRRNWPFLPGRRIDAYGGITSRVLDDAPWGKGR